MGSSILTGAIPLDQSIDLQPSLMSLTQGRVILDLHLRGYKEIPAEIIKKKKILG